MHHQIGIGDAGVNVLDALNGQDVASGRTGELVGAVAGADGDGQRVDLGGLDELRGFFRIGEQLRVIQHAFGAGTVFFTHHAGFQ